MRCDSSWSRVHRRRRETAGDPGRRESCDVPLPEAADPSKRWLRLETPPGSGFTRWRFLCLSWAANPGFSPGERLVALEGGRVTCPSGVAVSGPIEPSLAGGMFFPLVLRGGRHSRPIQPSRFPAEPPASQPTVAPRAARSSSGVRCRPRGADTLTLLGRGLSLVAQVVPHPLIAVRVHGRRGVEPRRSRAESPWCRSSS